MLHEKRQKTIPKTYTLFGKVLIAMARLEIQGISQGFGEVDVLRDVTFDVESGEIACLLGPSGCGKTTLFHVISGLASPRAGRVLLDGEDITGRPGHLSYMLQKDLLLQHKRIIDNVSLPLVLRGVPVEEARSRAAELFGVFGLEGTERRWPSELSGGMRQRVGIARALIMNPKLIIADECISALDVSIQAQVVNLMKDIQQETGTAYLFIAHDLSMVKYISDRIGVLHLGHLLETGTTEEIFENPIHPYTRSLLSAIPLPNPVVEKRRVAETYDYASSGIDYNKGTDHLVSGSHYVKCTDEEFAKWCR